MQRGDKSCFMWNFLFSSLLWQSKLPPASPLSPLSFPHCLQAPAQRLEQYCEALEELGGINPASDSALSILRHAQRHGEDLRASDLIVGCPVRMPVPVSDSATVKSHFLFSLEEVRGAQ